MSSPLTLTSPWFTQWCSTCRSVSVTANCCRVPVHSCATYQKPLQDAGRVKYPLRPSDGPVTQIVEEGVVILAVVDGLASNAIKEHQDLALISQVRCIGVEPHRGPGALRARGIPFRSDEDAWLVPESCESHLQNTPQPFINVVVCIANDNQIFCLTKSERKWRLLDHRAKQLVQLTVLPRLRIGYETSPDVSIAIFTEQLMNPR